MSHYMFNFYVFHVYFKEYEFCTCSVLFSSKDNKFFFLIFIKKKKKNLNEEKSLAVPSFAFFLPCKSNREKYINQGHYYTKRLI